MFCKFATRGNGRFVGTTRNRLEKTRGKKHIDAAPEGVMTNPEVLIEIALLNHTGSKGGIMNGHCIQSNRVSPVESIDLRGNKEAISDIHFTQIFLKANRHRGQSLRRFFPLLRCR